MDHFLNQIVEKAKTDLNYREPTRQSSLESAATRLARRFDSPPMAPPGTDLTALVEEIQRQFNETGPECLAALGNRERSWIPWTLYHGKKPQPVEWPGYLDAAISDFRKRKRWGRLQAWIFVYLKNYKAGTETTKKLASFLERALARYGGKRPRMDRWKRLMPLLFTAKALDNTVSWLLESALDTDEAIAYLGLEGELAFSPFVTDLLDRAIDTCEPNLPGGLRRITELLEIRGDRGTKVRSMDCLRHAASVLIRAAAGKPSVDVEKILYPVILNHLTDPRLPGGRPRWSGVSETAVHTFTQWLAREDLEFFFNLVDRTAKDRHWRYRRTFWESYLPHVEMTWVVLGKQARRLVFGIKGMDEIMRNREYGRLSGTSHDQSIFLIQMGGHIFVEWSHDGACGIWPREDAPFDLGRNDYNGPELRAPKLKERRIVHMGAWQQAAIRKIYRFTNLRPGVTSTRRRSRDALAEQESTLRQSPASWSSTGSKPQEHKDRESTVKRPATSTSVRRVPRQKPTASPFDSPPESPQMVQTPKGKVRISRGQRVKHPIWGEGRILQVGGSGDNMRATIQFSSATKKVMLKYAALEMIETDFIYTQESPLLPYLVRILSAEGAMTVDALSRRLVADRGIKLDKKIKSSVNRAIGRGLKDKKIKYAEDTRPPSFQDRIVTLA